MYTNALENVIEKSAEFTRNHMLAHFEDKKKHPISIIFTGASKPHVDLINYTMIFFNTVFLYEFHNEFNRFPGIIELKKTETKAYKLLKELEEGISKYKLSGIVNFIDLSNNSKHPIFQ